MRVKVKDYVQRRYGDHVEEEYDEHRLTEHLYF
jgi:hypothetical protein